MKQSKDFLNKLCLIFPFYWLFTSFNRNASIVRVVTICTQFCDPLFGSVLRHAFAVYLSHASRLVKTLLWFPAQSNDKQSIFKMKLYAIFLLCALAVIVHVQWAEARPDGDTAEEGDDAAARQDDEDNAEDAERKHAEEEPCDEEEGPAAHQDMENAVLDAVAKQEEEAEAQPESQE